jgi:hypothetical protein
MPTKKATKPAAAATATAAPEAAGPDTVDKMVAAGHDKELSAALVALADKYGAKPTRKAMRTLRNIIVG